jgi:hypothetical protein
MLPTKFLTLIIRASHGILPSYLVLYCFLKKRNGQSYDSREFWDAPLRTAPQCARPVEAPQCARPVEAPCLLGLRRSTTETYGEKLIFIQTVNPVNIRLGRPQPPYASTFWFDKSLNYQCIALEV